jgi:hypothetical protein
MNLMTKVLLIALTVLVIGGLCATLIYYGDEIFGARSTTTTTIKVSTITGSGLPAEEATYIQTMNSFDSQVVAAINTINGLLNSPQISDQSWANSMSAASGEILRLYNAATQIHVPNQNMAQYHNYYVNNVTSNLYMSLQFITSAINEGNATYLSQAKNYITTGTLARTQYFNQLNSYVATYY